MPVSLMIIDNDQVNSFVIRNIILRNYADARVSMFANGKDALEYLSDMDAGKGEFPGIILLDIYMPGLDGFQFLDTYSAHWGHRHTHLFAMSHAINKEDQLRANTYEVVKGFITKPLIYNNIEFIVETYLKSGAE